mgnify:FL=1
MNIEDIELENVERIERQLIEKFAALPKALSNNIETIKTNLKLYSIDADLVNRVNEEMYNASKLEDIKDIESVVRELTQTFWD